MDYARFGTLVTRLERYATAHPATYRLRVVLFALVGYAFLFAVVAALLALLAAVVYGIVEMRSGNYLMIKFAIALLLLIGVVVKAMWVEFPPPTGFPLTRQDAPRLFAFLDELHARVGGPRFHAVLAQPVFNAAVTEVPRLGVLGWPLHYLILGLPLMQATSLAQFRAVIAHEIGHRAGRHGRIFGWIYRVRQSWVRLLAALEEDNHGAKGMFATFFRWYAPRFEAYSFVLARAQEYEADRLAARVTSPDDVRQALATIAIGAAYYEGVLWSGVERRIAGEPAPPAGMHADLSSALRAGPPDADAARLLEAELRRPTDYADTHPSLTDRVAALGLEAPAPGPLAMPDETAAEALLGDQVGRIEAEFDVDWRRRVEPAWRDRHRQLAKARERLTELEAASATSDLSPGDATERAMLTLQLDGADSALPLLEAAAAAAPQNADLQFTLGRELLARDPGRGIALLEATRQNAPRFTMPVCQALAGHYAGVRDVAGLERERRRAQEEDVLVQNARQERQGVAAGDALEPHQLAVEPIDALRQELARHPEVRAAWLARKTLRWIPEEPYYVLIAHAKVPFFTTDRKKFLQGVAQALSHLPAPGETWIVVVASSRDALAKSAAGTGPSSLIFTRNS